MVFYEVVKVEFFCEVSEGSGVLVEVKEGYGEVVNFECG